MARLLALNIGSYYRVMNRGSSRKSIFLEDKDRERFLELLGETSRQWKRQFCIVMGNQRPLLHY